MQGPIVAIQLLELTSISGEHESLWSFSTLNESTGPGRSIKPSGGWCFGDTRAGYGLLLHEDGIRKPIPGIHKDERNLTCFHSK